MQAGDDTIVSLNTSGNNGAEMSIRLVDATAASLTGEDFVL